METAYETRKDRLSMENFTGTKPVLLQQDIYSAIYISSLAEDIIRNAEAEPDEKEKHRKHKMMVNPTLSIGILKNDLIYILPKDTQKQDKLFQQIYDDISKNPVPVRPAVITIGPKSSLRENIQAYIKGPAKQRNYEQSGSSMRQIR